MCEGYPSAVEGEETAAVGRGTLDERAIAAEEGTVWFCIDGIREIVAELAVELAPFLGSKVGVLFGVI